MGIIYLVVTEWRSRDKTPLGHHVISWHKELDAANDAAVKMVEERYGKKVESWDEWFTINERNFLEPYRVIIKPFEFFNQLRP